MALYPNAPGGGGWMFCGGDSGGYNPADTTPYYWGLSLGLLTGDPTTTAPTAAAVNIPIVRVPMTITDVYLLTSAQVVGSTETGTFALRINNTTDQVIFNNVVQWNAAIQAYTANNLTIALAPGDFFCPKITPPAWGTNPTGTFHVVHCIYTTP